MWKKHFKAFAAAIACIDDVDERARAAKMVAEVCSEFSGRFDRERFFGACGVQVGALLRAYGRE